jgi:cytochrome c-type biogenesis protein CcmH/NrfG|tara:strand:+ start:4181 stop:4777 length:597 start_codon:yes stop_codon:yes gene_type:complete
MALKVGVYCSGDDAAAFGAIARKRSHNRHPVALGWQISLGEDAMRISQRVLAAVTLPFLVLPATPAFAIDPVGYLGTAARDSSPHLTVARAFIGGENFAGAIAALEPILADNPSDVDALSLMGFSQRKNGDHDAALGYYTQALALDPEHLGTNEYLGELYVETGQLALAEERLGVLETTCGAECNEYKELAAFIAAAQ